MKIKRIFILLVVMINLTSSFVIPSNADDIPRKYPMDPITESEVNTPEIKNK